MHCSGIFSSIYRRRPVCFVLVNAGRTPAGQQEVVSSGSTTAIKLSGHEFNNVVRLGYFELTIDSRASI